MPKYKQQPEPYETNRLPKAVLYGSLYNTKNVLNALDILRDWVISVQDDIMRQIEGPSTQDLGSAVTYTRMGKRRGRPPQDEEREVRLDARGRMRPTRLGPMSTEARKRVLQGIKERWRLYKLWGCRNWGDYHKRKAKEQAAGTL